jgi:iron complex transport system substrate-binding protein
MRGTIRVTPSVRPWKGFLFALVSLLLAASCAGVGVPGATGGPTGSVESIPSSARPAPSASPVPTVEPSTSFPVELTDDEGTAVSLGARPERIVSLTPAATETLFAIGAGGRVVAGTDFDDYPPEAAALPDVATFAAVDVEAIVGLEPDLVIAGGNSFNDPAAIEHLRELGVPVLVVYPPTVEAVFADIELVARAVGSQDNGADLTASLRAELDRIAAATRDVERPRVFYELDASTEIYGPADDSFIVELIELAGGDPITTGSTTAFAIPLERLVEADPEVIVLGDANYGVTAAAVAERPGWGGMTAVEEGAIRPVDDIVVTRPGPRIAQGLRELALAIHPDLELPGSAEPSDVPVASAVPSATGLP